MKKLMKLKQWQVFIGIFSLYLVNTLTYTFEFNIGNVTSDLLRIITGIIYTVVFFTWVMLVGIFLNKIEDNPYHFNNIILVFAILSCIAGYSILYLEQLDKTENTSSLIRTFAHFPFTFFGLFFVFTRVPKSLKSLESGLKAPFRFYLTDAILMFILPIGIWFLQPRLNRIYAVNEEIIKEKQITDTDK